MPEPRLRFDRTAVGLVRRLQATLARFVPEGKTVVVTITAPIRQDSRTGAAMHDSIRGLLAARRTSRLIGFVHNPEPDPSVLFTVTRSLLACMGSGKRARNSDHGLTIANHDGLAPVETVRQVCLALRARSVFKRILVAERGGVRAL